LVRLVGHDERGFIQTKRNTNEHGVTEQTVLGLDDASGRRIGGAAGSNLLPDSNDTRDAWLDAGPDAANDESGVGDQIVFPQSSFH
jgi:hypothetical protein